MFSKDPKKSSPDLASMLKDEAINQAKEAAMSKASARTQQAVNLAQQAASAASSLQAPAAMLTPGGGLTGGLNPADPDTAQAALRSALGLTAEPSGLVFTCEIGLFPAGTFQVTDFTLTEGLSSLYNLSLNVVSLLPYIEFQTHLGQAASLTVKRDGQIVRTVNGILAGGVQGNTDGVKTWYHFDIRPEMWIMTLNQDSRIFQDQNAPAILKTLLDEAHVKSDCLFYREALHPERTYTTQKRESAYDFWCRLAFEEGINFWFEEDQMFYSDEHMGMTAGISLTYNPQANTDITDSTATTWQYGEYLCPDQLIQKDNNYVRPSYPLMHQDQQAGGGQHSVFESYGRFQLDAEGEPLTKARFEQLRSGSRVGNATTNCFALRPGKIFTLQNHPHAPMNDSWQVITVTHHGVQPLADNGGGEGTQLSNTVSFIPGREEWRPPHRYKPTADGDELATVVGPPGEEIYVNEYGAVKVHFHWDRDHSASCWVRVAMGWSGNGYGFSAVPRIGTVVQVSYLNGDIDRPIITGCTYDGRNAPPIRFPENKTRTTFRTQTHKGEGFNELRFEDEDGKQEVFIHAQKDMNTVVRDNRSTTVGANHKEVILQNQTVSVHGSQSTSVQSDQKNVVFGNQQSIVDGEVVIASAKGIRLISGTSVLQLSPSGRVTIACENFDFYASGSGQIATGEILDLNMDNAAPGITKIDPNTDTIASTKSQFFPEK
ncbi:type VI secretion system Vgr family protein [Providencia stuartii]|uniref:type VI secretion system Vgr family protein n=1 Tax=Providencia stuartii TaxID=588 RepID=UPI00146CFA4A|nr:type VI secretion system tip protein TssI/VgrG [Providencia stuartii]NMT49960.1 type VI secretion system tip protein VgrG [Providencia stuartii]